MSGGVASGWSTVTYHGCGRSSMPAWVVIHGPGRAGISRGRMAPKVACSRPLPPQNASSAALSPAV